MKKTLLFFILILIGFASRAQNKSWSADNGDGTFTNPLFYDEFSDPDIIRVGEEYYLAGTTMHSMPGIIILKSNDLVNWQFVSYCTQTIDFDSFDLDKGEGYGQGIWAPCIRFHEGKFYVFSNINGYGLQVYIADKPQGPWQHKSLNGSRIYDLSILFDQGKIYAVHGYGEVHVTQIANDFSRVMEETDHIVVQEGNAVGEGHHFYKIDDTYYITSADYAPSGRMQCLRSKNIFGPYETTVISTGESHGTKRSMSTINVGLGSKVPEKGFDYQIDFANDASIACADMHQGGIIQTPKGEWWGFSMLDYNAVGRTICLSPITWEDGWPYFGLENNLGRSPLTYFVPDGKKTTPNSPYQRCDDFSKEKLNPIWQFNHNPKAEFYSLSKNKGKFSIFTRPAKDVMHASNTLTQRAIGPISIASVEMDFSKLKDGDNAGVVLMNLPWSEIYIQKEGKNNKLVFYNAYQNKEIVKEITGTKIYFKVWGDYKNQKAQYSYSVDNKEFSNIGDTVFLPYQLKTFQGIRIGLFAYNSKNQNGGCAMFDNFEVEEPYADRSKNIPTGKTIRIKNLSDNSYMIALKHGLVHKTFNANDEFCKFKIEKLEGGICALKSIATDSYIGITGIGLSGDVRLFKNLTDDCKFIYQDLLFGRFMLLSCKNNLIIGADPIKNDPYSCDFKGASPMMKEGCSLIWEEF